MSKTQKILIELWQKTPSRMLVRLPGGFWVIADGVNTPSEKDFNVGTATVRALVGKGVVRMVTSRMAELL